MRISQRYLDFNAEVEEIVAYLTAENQTRLGVPTTQYDELTALVQTWTTALAAYQSPATHTPESVEAMRQSYAELGLFVRNLQQQVKNNASVDLTPADYAGLYIHIDKTTRTRINTPEHAPDVRLLHSEHLMCEFEAQVPNPQEANHLALPEHMKLGRKLAVVPAGGAAPAEADYHPLDNVGRGKFRLSFAPAEEGMDGYIICSYYNPRGEHGPESKPLKFTII